MHRGKLVEESLSSTTNSPQPLLSVARPWYRKSTDLAKRKCEDVGFDRQDELAVDREEAIQNAGRRHTRGNERPEGIAPCRPAELGSSML